MLAVDRPRLPRCPTCGAPAAWRDNPQRPFCSLRCRLVDLGGWLDERYRIAGPEVERADPPPPGRPRAE
jgi:hypothetical protein